MAKCVKAIHWSWAVVAMIVIAVTCGSAGAATPVPALIETPKSSAAMGLTGTPRPTAMERSQPMSTPASVSRYGGDLRIALYDGVYGWDPKESSFFSSIQVVSQLYNQIVQYDTRDTGRVICDLCESWDVSDDGQTFTFHIRPGIKWLDGQDLTAEDVHHSMLRYGDPASPASLSGRWRGYTLVVNDGGVNYIDSRSVEFNLPFSGAFIKSLALDYVKVLPKHLLEQGIDLNLPENVIDHQSGSGPFVLESYREGRNYRVSKNRDYFKEGRPYLNSIEHFVINETGTLIASLLAGLIHMSNGFHRLPPTEALDLEAESNGAMRAVAMPYGDNGLLLNVKKEPFDDPRVRKAIALAIDYQDWDQQIFDSKSRVGCPLLGLAHSYNECAAWPGIRPKDTPEGQADLEEAKRLMAEAGFPDGLISKYGAPRWVGTYSDQCEVLQSQLKDVLGIEGAIQTYDRADFLDHLNTSRPSGQVGNWAMACLGHDGVVADVDYIMDRIYQRNGSLNFTNWENDRVNAWFELQRAETDPARRREINKELELFLASQVDNHWITLGQNVRFWMIDEQIQGFHAPQTRYTHYKHEDLWLGNIITVAVARSTASPLRINSPVPVIATFARAVSGFTVDDITVANGTVGNFAAAAGGMVYTFDVTPSDIGRLTVDIAADVAEDADGNGNTAAVQLQLGIPYDDNRNGLIERSEVIKAINDYLRDGSLERSHVIALINLYLSE